MRKATFLQSKRLRKHLVVLFASLFAFILLPAVAYASHSWGNYHWARTANPFALKLGDNVSVVWDTHLATTSADWSVSSVLDTQIVPGLTTSRRCKATTGRVEVCNYRYGNNGWLGLAQIWVSGSHIVKGIVKANDTYFNTTKYNTPAWRNLVMCQEVGHTLGLDHQDEGFDNGNLNTCMDYTNDPSSNQHPNAHDYEQLELIYAHLDGFTSVNQTKAQIAQSRAADKKNEEDDLGDDPKGWGKKVKDNGRVALFERDLGGGKKVFTHVIWAQE